MPEPSPDEELFIGERGGVYYLRNGRKFYLPEGRKAMGYRKKQRDRYKPPRGAFTRYLQNNFSVKKEGA